MSKPTNYNFVIITEEVNIFNFDSEKQAKQKTLELKAKNISFELLHHIGDGVYKKSEIYFHKSKRGKYGKQQI